MKRALAILVACLTTCAAIGGTVWQQQWDPSWGAAAVDASIVLNYEFTTNWGTSTNQVAWDSSGKGNHGYATNANTAPAWSNGVAVFDGVDDCLEVPSGATVASATGLTITAWIKRLDGVNQAVLAEANQSGSVYYSRVSLASYDATTARGLFRMGTGIEITGTAQSMYGVCATNAWRHIALVLDASTDAHYFCVNGVAVATNTTATDPFVSTVGKTTLGYYFATAGYRFHGPMDDVRIYRRALSVAEVMALYTSTTNPTPERP